MRRTSRADPPGKVTQYVYDASGNLTSATYDPSGANQVTGYTYDGANRLSGMTLPSGTVVASYAYDAWGAPTSATEFIPNANGWVNPYRYAGRSSPLIHPDRSRVISLNVVYGRRSRSDFLHNAARPPSTRYVKAMSADVFPLQRRPFRPHLSRRARIHVGA